MIFNLFTTETITYINAKITNAGIFEKTKDVEFAQTVCAYNLHT